jgi:hypothetical protein
VKAYQERGEEGLRNQVKSSGGRRRLPGPVREKIRDIVSRIDALIARLEEVSQEGIDEDVREKLEELIERARRLLEAAP